MSDGSLEGKTLGKYRVLQPLGQGGMARVYRAYHPQLDRYVAVKVLRQDVAGEAEMTARFKREAKAVAALRHPHIVQVFDFDTQDDLCYMVMELVEGDSLKTRLTDYRTRGSRIPNGEAVRIVLDALGGLEYAHHAGIVHRDIKPANILLTGDGAAVLSDFGIAQVAGGTQYTSSGAMMGTLQYMAPEQGLARGDARSDIYSMGIVLYEMLVGEPPFDADTPLAILLKHMNDPLPIPREKNPEIPEPLERILLKALSKQPEGRYASAKEMARALAEAAAGAGIGVPERISRPLSFTTAASDADTVSIYTSAERAKLADAAFSKDRTDANLPRTLARKNPPAEGSARTVRILRTVFISLSLILLYFMFSLTAAAALNRAEIMEKTWPVVILLPVFLLGGLGEDLNNPWMAVPMPLLMLTAVLLAFFVGTGRWELWPAWLLEPIALFAGIAVPVGEATDPRHGDFQATRGLRRIVTGAGLVFFIGWPLFIFVSILAQ
ncbi:MAG: serine/threonine protein kinase [Anaerolineales bacterium]|nr:serine/threonine protein kinase [Anaerolineales bacterium]